MYEQYDFMYSISNLTEFLTGSFVFAGADLKDFI